MTTKNKPYSIYVLKAVKDLKEHIDKDPFFYKTAAELLECVSEPNRALVENAFKKEHGLSIKAYQVKKRLEMAKKFLEEGISKKQVAAKCYYSSQTYFAAVFKKQFKMTPTQWLSSNSD